jgi:hypothetical protein
MADIERRTGPVNGSTTKPTPGDKPPETNVLHKYRSVNYLFTISALTSNQVSDPKTYNGGQQLQYVILKSGGKGSAVLGKRQVDPATTAAQGLPPVTDATRARSLAADNAKLAAIAAEKSNEPRPLNDKDANSLVGEFNQVSPGRFDMFIDNLEIETIMARDKNSTSTQPTKITFDVFEPYSINGFIEALQVASQAAGHPSYAKAPFVLKMEFLGYPDDGDMPEAKVEKYGTRYFPFTITKCDVTLDERGTKYAIEAVPTNEVAFGNPSTLKKSVKVGASSGGGVASNTVQGILEQLVRSVEEQVKKEAEDAEGSGSQYDKYKVKFPSWNGKAWVDSPSNDIAASKVTEITEDKNLFTMPDPGKQLSDKKKYTMTSKETESKDNSQPKSVPFNPSNPVIQFNEGRTIQECMEAIVRDSRWVRDKLEKMMGNQFNEVVKENMIDYFLIKLEVKELPQIDKTKNKHYYEYTFVVTPYKMLYTRVPGFGNQTVDQKLLYQACIRKYDYIYTGNNLDITNFKLSFNNLYFEGIPVGLGKPGGVQSRETTTKTDETQAKKVNNGEQSTDKGLPATGAQSDAKATAVQNRSGGQTQLSPYYAMAQAFHNAIISDQSTNMITGELDILGDPIYLVTGGLGNNSPESPEGSPRVSESGEAQFNYGDVFVNINFRNPIDIGPDGFYQFDDKLLPFSGVYLITTCKSKFRDGQFKQTLNIIRQPGQALPTANPAETPQSSKTPITDPSKTHKVEPNPDEATTRDATPISADSAGVRPDEMTLRDQLGTSYPNPGLPGTNGSQVTVVPGINPNLPAVSRMISPLGISEQPSFSMPIPAKAATGLLQRVYSPGGYVQSMGMGILNSFGVKGPAAQLANQYLGNIARKINSVPILGSGIGVGASINIVKNNANPQTNAEYQNQQLPEQPTANPTAAGLSGNALGYLANNLTAIPGITNNSALLAQSALQGNSTDPLAVAAAFGVNQAQIAGLSPNLTSVLVGKLESLTKSVPADTDLNTAVKNGVNLNGLTQNDVAALPPTAPFRVADSPRPDQAYLNRLSASGGPSAVAKAFGVNSINEVSQTELPADAAQTTQDASPSILQRYKDKLGLNNVNSAQDAAVLGLKLYAERGSLLGPTGIAGSLEGNFIGVRNQLGPVNVVGDLGKSAPNLFGSKSSGSSPLDKIMIR